MTTPAHGEHLSLSSPGPEDPAVTAAPASSGQGSQLPPYPATPPHPATTAEATTPQNTVEQPAPSATDGADESVRRPRRFMRVALALAAVVGIGGGIAYAAHGSDKPAPRPAAGSTPKPGTPSHSAVASQPTPTASPSETLPYGGTEPTLGGKYYSAGKYDPTTPVAIPYSPGQKATKAIVETLLRNVDVAITSDDVNQLLYAGIEPGSELASNIQAQQMVSYESNLEQARALTHVFSETLDDRDIKFDPNDPNHAEVLVRNGSDFDINYAPDRVSYDHIDMRLGHKVETLPSGQTEDIWRIQYQLVSKSTFDQWLVGYQQ